MRKGGGPWAAPSPRDESYATPVVGGAVTSAIE
jgi:hypothetical protein